MSIRISKRTVLPVLFVLTVSGIFYFSKDKATVSKEADAKQPAPLMTSVRPIVSKQGRLPANFPGRKKPMRRPAQVGRGFAPKPSDYEPEFEAAELGKNVKLVKNLNVISLTEFNQSMGTLVQTDQHFAFFTPAGEVQGHPVAFDRVTNSFHPVSHILHIKKVTPEVRQNLADQGHTEYYFNERMKFLSLETTPKTVLSTYHQLKSLGLDVQMEVLKDVVQSK